MANQLALIGFGEAGSTFATSGAWDSSAIAYDIDERRVGSMRDAKVLVAADAESALRHATIVLSLVTADQAVNVARDYGVHIRLGAMWLDMNSVAPSTKRQAAAIVEQQGGRYIDVAVLAPVDPGRMNVPLLLSGPEAEDARTELIARRFTNVRVVGCDVGQASAVKMIRSVMIKGIEALTFEMIEAAEAAGVREEVLASLDASEKAMPWTDRAAYNRERMATHGVRRAAEMEEAAKTLRQLGIDPVMTDATVRRQRDAAGRAPITKDAA